MHEHIECEHELKYCKKCKVAYCEKCKEEWIEKIKFTINQPATTWIGDGTYPNITYFTGHIHGKDLE